MRGPFRLFTCGMTEEERIEWFNKEGKSGARALRREARENPYFSGYPKMGGRGAVNKAVDDERSEKRAEVWYKEGNLSSSIRINGYW
jgi:hypothetical protein